MCFKRLLNLSAHHKGCQASHKTTLGFSPNVVMARNVATRNSYPLDVTVTTDTKSNMSVKKNKKK